jgi:signal transduction histidine kinase
VGKNNNPRAAVNDDTDPPSTASPSGAGVQLIATFADYDGMLNAMRMRARERQLSESEARLRTLSAQLLTTQEEERRGISRDLHDELGALLTDDPRLSADQLGRILAARGKNLPKIDAE